MKLIRHGVFETNSSSAHSLAYTNKVLRDYEYKINPSECLKDSRFRLTEMPEDYKHYKYMPLYFDDYGWSGKCLTSPANKLSYLLTSVYEYKTWGEMLEDTFFNQIVQWLTELNIDLEYEYPGDDERIDGYIDHQSYDVVCKQMFNSKEDLLTYLFNDDIVVYIENDNDEFQEWVVEPEDTVGFNEAMYWVCSRGRCVRRKSWEDDICVYIDGIYSQNQQFLGTHVIKNYGGDKWLYDPSQEDMDTNDWVILWGVNKYEID